MDISRRDFVKTTTAAGAGAMLANVALAQQAAAAGGDIKVGFIGVGKQGRVLLQDALKIPGVRFEAVCDIWESYNLRYAKGRLRRHNPELRTYTDYKEMLAKETGLDACIVATPDFMHAEHAIACVKAGLNVYCEKEMSNTLENAAAMVKAARDTGKIMQIGHQRRSNPVYLHALEMIEKDDLCGKLTNCYGQWNRPVQEQLTCPDRVKIAPDALKAFGYENMDHFLNWRWFRKYSAGPIADLGSHQIDIFAWFLGCEPSSVMAVGGKDYYGDREWYEDVLCLYEYQTKKGSARAFYQVINTNGFGNYYEKFSGDKGTIVITENPKMCQFLAEPGYAEKLPAWLTSVEPETFNGQPSIPFMKALPKKNAKAAADMAACDEKNVHQFHLENFFGAVKANNKALLTCPPEVAYPTAVAVLSAIPAIEAGKKIELTEESYHA